METFKNEEKKRLSTTNYVKLLESQIHSVIQFVRINKLHNPLLAGFKISPVLEMKAKVDQEVY
jgi:hypothetical protein